MTTDSTTARTILAICRSQLDRRCCDSLEPHLEYELASLLADSAQPQSVRDEARLLLEESRGLA